MHFGRVFLKFHKSSPRRGEFRLSLNKCYLLSVLGCPKGNSGLFFCFSATQLTQRLPCEDAMRMSRPSGDFPVQLAIYAYLINHPAVCCECYPSVRVSCRSPNSTSPTRTTCSGQVASILVRHARLPRDMLATSSRGRNEDDTSKLLPWNSA